MLDLSVQLSEVKTAELLLTSALPLTFYAHDPFPIQIIHIKSDKNDQTNDDKCYSSVPCCQKPVIRELQHCTQVL